MAKPKAGYHPRVCVVIPCKGEEAGLERNIVALLKQDCDNYQTIIVTDTDQDRTYRIAQSVLSQHPNARAQVAVSSTYPNASGKVAAMLTVLELSSFHSVRWRGLARAICYDSSAGQRVKSLLSHGS